jgi:hypothetical protein
MYTHTHTHTHTRFHPVLLRPVHISLREGSFGVVMMIFIMHIIPLRTDCLLPACPPAVDDLDSYGLLPLDPHDLLLQTIVCHRQNFGGPSVPSWQNCIFPMCAGERYDGISTLHSHQYSLADEGVTEEMKRQTFVMHFFTPRRHKVLMRGILDQQVRHCAVGLLACTRSGDVGVYLHNFTFPLTVCHASLECLIGCLLFVLLLGGVSIENFLSHLEESVLQYIICLTFRVFVFYCHLKTYCGPSSETIQSPE